MKIPESHFEDLGDGRVRVRYKDGGGVWRRKVIKGKTNARNFYIEAHHASLQGQGFNEKRMRTPLRIFAEQWLAAQPPSVHTQQNKSSHLRNHLIPALGDKRVGSIQHLDVQRWITSLEAKGLTANSIRHISGTARTLFADAKRDGYIRENPCTDWKRPTVPQRKLVPAEIGHLHACVVEMPERLRAAVFFAAGTGLRPAELFGVKVDDFVEQRKKSVIHVGRQVHSYTGKPQQVVERTKTYQGRIIPIDDGLAEILTAHINLYPSAERFIFTNELGKPLHAHVFNRAWLRARRRVAMDMRAKADKKFTDNPIARARAYAQAEFIERLRFYDLRHFFASLIMKKTKNIKLVQALLGHTTAQMSLNNYVHLAEDDLHEARRATKKLFKIN